MTREVRRVIQSYDAEQDDELSLKIDQMVTIISIEENGWAEGILENQLVGWFPIECVVQDNSQLPADASTQKLQQMRLDNLFKNADVLDGTVNKRDSLVLTVSEKLSKRKMAINDLIECESTFVKSMNSWMSEVESNSVFSLLSKDQASSLLEANDDVVNFHQVLLGSLEVVRFADPADQMFGGYFLDFIPFFSEVYLKLKSLLPKIITCIVDSNKSQNLDMISVLHFSADLHVPVQHVTKMINFTRRILFVTPLDHEDWTFTMYSWRSLRDAVKKIDLEVREIESKETLNTFLEKLDFYDGPPIQSFGQLVRYGTVRIGDRRQICHVYLLEKKLFILRSARLSLPIGSKYKRNSLSSGAKLTIEHEIVLNSQHVKAISTNTDIGDDFFRISYFLPDKSIQSIDCYAFNREIKKVWVDLLNTLVAKHDDAIQAGNSKINPEDLYQDLMSVIENYEPSDNPPPLPPKNEVPEYYKNESELPSVPLSKVASVPIPLEDQRINLSEGADHQVKDVELDLTLDQDTFLDEKALMELNMQDSVSDNEELEPDELIRGNPLNLEPHSPVEFTSLEEKALLAQDQDGDKTLSSISDVKLSEQSTPELLATDAGFVSDEEYQRLLSAYQEKVAQVEELRQKLINLSEEQ